MKRQSGHTIQYNMTSINDREFWEQFIRLYQIHPCLWNSKSKDYSNKHLREAAYTQLVEKTRERFPLADRDFVTKKIHTLRCSFRREHKKVQDSKKNASAGSAVYVPTLWYYEQLSFITDFGYTRSGKVAESSTDEDDNEEEYANQVVEPQPPAITNPPPAPVRQVHQKPAGSKTAIASSSTNKRKYYKAFARKQLSMPPVKKISPKKLEPESLDEFDIAGRKYASDLRNMTEPQRLIVEKLVAETIYYGKMEQLNVHSSIQYDNNFVHNPFIPKMVDYTSESGSQ